MASNQLFLWDWQTANPRVEVDPRHRSRRWRSLPMESAWLPAVTGKTSCGFSTWKRTRSNATLLDPKGEPLLVDDLAFTPDGKQLAAANSFAVGRRFLRRHSRLGHRHAHLLRHRLTISAAYPQRLAISADGKLLRGAMGNPCTCGVSKPGKPSAVKRQAHTAAVYGVCFSPKGEPDRHGERRWHCPHLERRHGPRTASARPWGAVGSGSDGFAGRHSRRHIGARRQSPHLADGDRKSVHVLKGHGNAGGWRAISFQRTARCFTPGAMITSSASGRSSRANLNEHSALEAQRDARWRYPLGRATPRTSMTTVSGNSARALCYRNGGNQLVLAGAAIGTGFSTRRRGEKSDRTRLPVLMTKANQPRMSSISRIVCSESGNKLLMSSAAPYRFRRSALRRRRDAEPIGSDKLTLVALDSGLPLWSTTLNGIGMNPRAGTSKSCRVDHFEEVGRIKGEAVGVSSWCRVCLRFHGGGG